MKMKFLVPVFAGLILITAMIPGCKKEGKQPDVTATSSPKWNTNDEKYLASLTNFTRNYHAQQNLTNVINSFCIAPGQDSTYGWFDDMDTCLIPGPYISAKAGPYESMAENCPEFQVVVQDAKTYLLSEGYSDIVQTWTPKAHIIVHAANSLLDLKNQILNATTQSRTEGLWTCIFEAVGVAQLAEIVTNWASLSTREIMKRVAKLLRKNLGWFGAIAATISFVDCVLDL